MEKIRAFVATLFFTDYADFYTFLCVLWELGKKILKRQDRKGRLKIRLSIHPINVKNIHNIVKQELFCVHFFIISFISFIFKPINIYYEDK